MDPVCTPHVTQDCGYFSTEIVGHAVVFTEKGNSMLCAMRAMEPPIGGAPHE